jgi:uncharacterized protein (TIGR02145 family)
MKKSILFLAVFAFFVNKNHAQTITDYDGNVYNTVTIGTQVWMKENLKVTHYRNGDSIPNIKVDTTWRNLRTGAYCDYNNSPDTSKTYGRLYNWYAVDDSRNIAPVGWHIPTDCDWINLITYLGGPIVAGDKMKEGGSIHWNTSAPGASNSSGFTALPGGYRDIDGYYYLNGHQGLLLSSTLDSNDLVWILVLIHTNSTATTGVDCHKNDGYSVRCLRDLPAQINEINENEKINIYPNPAKEKIYVNCAIKQNLEVRVYNTIGQCVLQRELNKQTTDIDIGSLTKGIYILKLTSPKGTIEKKIIKE